MNMFKFITAYFLVCCIVLYPLFALANFLAQGSFVLWVMVYAIGYVALDFFVLERVRVALYNRFS